MKKVADFIERNSQRPHHEKQKIFYATMGIGGACVLALGLLFFACNGIPAVVDGTEMAGAVIGISNNVPIPSPIGSFNFDNPQIATLKTVTSGVDGKTYPIVAGLTPVSVPGLFIVFDRGMRNGCVDVTKLWDPIGGATPDYQSITVSAWVNRPTTNPGKATIFYSLGSYDVSIEADGSVVINTRVSQSCGIMWSDTLLKTAAGTVPAGSYRHVVWTKESGIGDNAGKIVVYVDGVVAPFVGDDSIGMIPGSIATNCVNTFGFITGMRKAGCYPNGAIDNLEIYDRALSEDEVSSLYNAERPAVAVDPSVTKQLTIITPSSGPDKGKRFVLIAPSSFTAKEDQPVFVEGMIDTITTEFGVQMESFISGVGLIEGVKLMTPSVVKKLGPTAAGKIVIKSASEYGTVAGVVVLAGTSALVVNANADLFDKCFSSASTEYFDDIIKEQRKSNYFCGKMAARAAFIAAGIATDKLVGDKLIKYLAAKRAGKTVATVLAEDAVIVAAATSARNAEYAAYVARKTAAKEVPRTRLEWEDAMNYFWGVKNIARGNAFNALRTKYYRDTGGFNEIILANGKRLDAYVLPTATKVGEIISRKATTLDDIELNTFKKYLSELKSKYYAGLKIVAGPKSANLPIAGKTISGKQILEIPDINLKSSSIKQYMDIAKSYGVELRFAPENNS